MATGPLRDSVLAAGESLADRVSFGEDDIAPHSCDLVVASGMDVPTLDRASVLLAPAGTLYVECDSPTSVDHVVGALTGFGFGDVQLVQPWPSREDPRAWLPTHPNVGGARYFLCDRPMEARHPIRRLAVYLRRRRWLRRISSRRVATICAVARLTTPASAMSADPWWVGDRRSRDAWLLLSHSRQPEARVVGLVLPNGSARPAVAVRLARTESSRRRLSHAADVMERLDELGFARRRRVPMLYERVVDARGTVVASKEQALHGTRLDATLRTRAMPGVLSRLTDWQIELAVATRRHPRDSWSSRLEPALEALRAAAAGVIDGGLVSEVEALLRSEREMPCVLEHHDFRPWNILVDEEGLMTAFDWDGARAEGIPALDLIHVHAYVGFSLDGTMRTRRFAASHRRSEESPIGRRRDECMARYRDAVGLTPDALRAVRAFAWTELCVEELHERVAAGRPLERRDLDRSLLALWTYEARRALG